MSEVAPVAPVTEINARPEPSCGPRLPVSACAPVGTVVTLMCVSLVTLQLAAGTS